MFRKCDSLPLIPFVFLVAMPGLGLSALHAQNSQGTSPSDINLVSRRIVIGVSNASYPVGPMEVFYDGKPVKSGAYFDAPDDWLKHITVNIKNVSATPAAAASLQLAFPGTGNPMIFHYFREGGHTTSYSLKQPGKNVQPRSVKLLF